MRFAGRRRPEPSSPAATARRTCSCWPRARRPTGWSSPRRWPAACRSSRPTSAACRRRSATAPTAFGRACWFPRTIPPRSAPRCAPGSSDADLRRRLRRAARERRESLARLVDHRRRSSRACWRRRRDDRRGRSASARAGSTCASAPTPTARATGARSHASPPSAGGRPAVIHDLGCGSGVDGPVARARCCPGRSTGSCTTATPTCCDRAAADPPAPPPTAPRSPSRRGSADITGSTRDDLAGASLITASALLDLLTRDELERLVAGCVGGRLPGAADALGHRPRRARARPTRSTRASRPRSTRTSAARRRAAACSARTPSGRRRRRSAGSGCERRRPAEPVAARRRRRRIWPPSGSPAGSAPRASRSPRWRERRRTLYRRAARSATGAQPDRLARHRRPRRPAGRCPAQHRSPR